MRCYGARGENWLRSVGRRTPESPDGAVSQRDRWFVERAFSPRTFRLEWLLSSSFAFETQVGEDVRSHLREPLGGVGIRKCREACIETPVVAR